MSLFVSQWCAVQNLEVWLDKSCTFLFVLCIVCHSEVKNDSLFDFGLCNTLNFWEWNESQFELEWYRVCC